LQNSDAFSNGSIQEFFVALIFALPKALRQ